MRQLYSFCWDCGRSGSISGLFVAQEDEVIDAISQYVHFGEVLGKHSSISGYLEAIDFEVVTADQDFIDKAIEYGVTPRGFNPLEYLDDEDAD